MKKVICLFKGHSRGFTKVKTVHNKPFWIIRCKRCGYEIGYSSPLARLIGLEIKFGFDGK